MTGKLTYWKYLEKWDVEYHEITKERKGTLPDADSDSGIETKYTINTFLFQYLEMTTTKNPTIISIEKH
jgi:hypothetical protein